MPDLIFPVAKVVDVVVYHDDLPMDMQGEVSGYLRGMKEAEDFAHAIGRTGKPKKPLMVYGPDEYMPILVIGDGVTEAAEMQDLAVEAIGRQAESVKKNGRGMNFDEARQRAGLVRKEDFDVAFRDALQRRVKYLKANPISHPRGR